jgi:hypothetical protein
VFAAAPFFEIYKNISKRTLRMLLGFPRTPNVRRRNVSARVLNMSRSRCNLTLAKRYARHGFSTPWLFRQPNVTHSMVSVCLLLLLLPAAAAACCQLLLLPASAACCCCLLSAAAAVCCRCLLPAAAAACFCRMLLLLLLPAAAAACCCFFAPACPCAALRSTAQHSAEPSPLSS